VQSTNRAEGSRDARLLARIALPLNPSRPPFYVVGKANHPDGWYWVPAGATHAQWIARNVFGAEAFLLEQLNGKAAAV
jgi:hypothetical protein